MYIPGVSDIDYHGHAGVNIFPTFPGQYIQGGLKSILAAEKSNLKGADFGIPPADAWDTRSVTAYTVSRLVWNHDEDVKEIARDYAAMHFGLDAAEELADILLLSARAYKYGIYIEPVSYGQFSSLTHLRLTTFPAQGLPRLDNGRKHIEFLRSIYLRCQPWQMETLLYLDHGL